MVLESHCFPLVSPQSLRLRLKPPLLLTSPPRSAPIPSFLMPTERDLPRAFRFRGEFKSGFPCFMGNDFMVDTHVTTPQSILDITRGSRSTYSPTWLDFLSFN